MNIKHSILLVASACPLIVATAIGQPIINKQPTNQSVSLGADVTFQISVSSTPPFSYQWRFNGSDLADATNRTLILTNAQLAGAGDYGVVLANISGSVTSQVACLDVDPTFTKITKGNIVSDIGTGAGSIWGDYDNDGFIDLFVTRTANYATRTAQKNLLYHNNRDGTFVKMTNSVVASEAQDWRGCAWADYDNDGHLDLFVTSDNSGGFSAQNILYRNDGSGGFTKMTATTAGGIVSAAGNSFGSAWADYDRDGFLDLFIARGGSDWLFQNNGDGTFEKITNSAVGVISDTKDNHMGIWGDYDNDGWPDLFVAVHDNNPRNQTNFLYRNRGDGTFTRVFNGTIATDSEFSLGCGWADYDNDGFLDLFVVNGLIVRQSNSLYHNNGDGTFTKMTSDAAGSIASDVAQFVTCAWGDYDNDGFLDVLVTKNDGGSNFLYHNDGGGSFTRILTGSVANDAGISYAASWGDYDNDGFLDLFVPRGGDVLAQSNLLYRNNGNSNHWLKVKLIGTVSNRSGIGARVRAKASIGGKAFWQLREIHSGNGWGANQLDAHFGLGDATNIETLRIEWPSGTVQEFHDVAVKQFLIVTEPPRLQIAATQPNGPLTLRLHGGIGFSYSLDASDDLANWLPLRTNTATSFTLDFEDAAAANAPNRFYRARLVP